MNSYWNKNIELLKNRFPELTAMLSEKISDFSKRGCEPVFTAFTAKNGELSASDNGTPLHSKYNPGREAEQLAESFNPQKNTAAVFLGTGLGYAAISFSKKFRDSTLVIIEPEPEYLFSTLALTDWESVLTMPRIIIATGAPVDACTAVLSNFSSNELCFISVPAWKKHAARFFEELEIKLSKKRQTENINTNTLERFANLWLTNSCKNLSKIQELDGVEKYRNLAGDIPFLVLSAGPSLSTILPHLKELKRHALIVCVDTALHACLKYGVQPDFIVLIDPQYSCALHLEFLKAPESVLITESAAWPSVFRFECKEIVLCSSLFPLGQYFENKLGNKGRLGAGGSVATTAWDFARWCGAENIYVAGMDLGFPGRQTHVRGSQFEERAHRMSNRIHPAETDGVASLMSSTVCMAKDFNGGDLLSDQRMSLFSWWFEKHCTELSSAGRNTYTLTPQSLAINGIKVGNPDSLLNGPDITEKRKDFFNTAEKNALPKASREEFSAVLSEFKAHLEKLLHLAKKGKMLADSALQNRTKTPYVSTELSRIDSQILNSDAKNAAALVFPTQRQLDELSRDFPKDKETLPMFQSRLIYSELIKAISRYTNELNKYF